MPSVALSDWQNDRLARLLEIENQCSASMSLTPPNLILIDENLRGYALALSAHFQGYCRDLYAESTQIVVSRIRPSLQLLIQDQFAAHCRLDQGNPTIDNVALDFDRFGFSLRTELSINPANATGRQHLSDLIKWRNVAAHQGRVHPSGIALTLANLQLWRSSLDGLAAALDGIMYNKLRQILRRKPW